MLFKIMKYPVGAVMHVSHALRRRLHCLIAAVVCLWSSSEPADVSTSRYPPCECLVHFLLHDTSERTVNRIEVRLVQRS